MKAFKLIIALFLMALTLFTSCKKEQSELENTTVTSEDLINYQMVWILLAPNNSQELRLLYFYKEGNEVKATLDGITSRIIKTVKLENSTLKLDLNDNGSVVYTFEFAKKDGNISLVSSKFFNINNPNYAAAPGMLSKSEFISVKSKVFKALNSNELISFNVDTWRFSAYPNIGGTFYECGTGGWKGKINGLDHMGVYWESGNGKIMAIQKFGYQKVEIFELY